MRKFILDCDPGMDDLIALAYALKTKLNLLAVTTVSGNVDCEHTTINALKFLDVFGVNIPVYKGAKHPLKTKPIHAPHIHGVDGCHGVLNHIKTERKPEEQSASRYLIEEILKNKNEIEIIAIGPLTNLALALIEKPDIAQYVKHIHIMGGGHAFGNIKPAAEFNFYADPFAAKIVFESQIPLTMVGLDATMAEGLSEKEINNLLAAAPQTEQNEIIAQLLKNTLKVAELFGRTEAYVHDLIAVVSVVKPEIVEMKEYFVGIETKGKYTFGKSVVDIDGVLKREPNAKVALGVNKTELLKALEDILNG